MSMQAVTAPPISAGETAYRYWSFWASEDDVWTYATQGPATMAAADGMTLGWRFGIATERDTSALEPQLTPITHHRRQRHMCAVLLLFVEKRLVRT